MKFNADAIVKALKCCNVPNGRACSECPYYEVGSKCITQRNKDAVELILELIEEKNKLNKSLEKELLDSARVYDNYCRMINGLRKEVDQIKAETAWKMKDKLINYESFDNGGGNYVVSIDDIRTVAKEMLEENNV